MNAFRTASESENFLVSLARKFNDFSKHVAIAAIFSVLPHAVHAQDIGKGGEHIEIEEAASRRNGKGAEMGAGPKGPDPEPEDDQDLGIVDGVYPGVVMPLCACAMACECK